MADPLRQDQATTEAADVLLIHQRLLAFALSFGDSVDTFRHTIRMFNYEAPSLTVDAGEIERGTRHG